MASRIDPNFMQELKEYGANSVGWNTSITNSDIGNGFEVRIEYYFRTDA